MAEYPKSTRIIKLKNKILYILSETTKRKRFSTELFVNINELEPYINYSTGENNCAVCILCGEPVIRSGNPLDRTKMHHVKLHHNEWMDAFYVSPGYKIYYHNPSEPKTWGTCPNCGTDLKEQPFKYHKYEYHCQECKSIFKSPRVKKHRVPLKPWKDPESLFCDTDFLKKIIGKEPAKGTECKDVHEREGEGEKP